LSRTSHPAGGYAEREGERIEMRDKKAGGKNQGRGGENMKRETSRLPDRYAELMLRERGGSKKPRAIIKRTKKKLETKGTTESGSKGGGDTINEGVDYIGWVLLWLGRALYYISSCTRQEMPLMSARKQNQTGQGAERGLRTVEKLSSRRSWGGRVDIVSDKATDK
jgi:hypothetical protein